MKSVLILMPYIICSNKWIFNRDLKQLKDSFLWSGYPCNTIEKYFNIYERENNSKLQNLLNVPRKQIYFGFQYINESSENFVQNISKLISKNFSFTKMYSIF